MRESVIELLYLKTPIGGLVVEIREQGLSTMYFSDSSCDTNVYPQTRLARLAYDQLMRYFDKPHSQFTIPIALSDQTSFRKRVWKTLSSIRMGSTATYKQIAQKLSTHPRAIGGACAANPIPIIIPCHRVIAQSGALCGYTGSDGKQNLSIKAWLLNHEKFQHQ